ncbi:glycoside hydrolase family 127 protein [Paenibacillus nanensis]|uniref:Glycoside hydrolase family 127 protein n=1 Tax=Paenibacillus nanensis TaxID=393251 RepID=A0A3A1VFE7_9BACL|nr:beta-L-arabinofuranosidase domain-containing protein [Paenibacillus nanensis]RIX59629.1 glycoside hydrolase family 127 protein [Paenibacillus nanensis]
MKQMQVLPLSDIKIEDRFWSEYIRLVREVVVPYQWETLNDRVPDAEPSRAIRNFRIAAGEESGEFYGMVFQDSDVAKWLEAAGYLLQSGRDPELERIADDLVDLIVKAQREDGYLNTYYMLKEPGNEWTNLCECHELYTAGHLIEGAVAYFQATGKRAILDVACKFADYIDSVFGPEPGKLQGYDGHQEIELALVKLYETTGEERYLRLSQFFLNERGKEPHFYDKEYEERGQTVHWGSDFMVKNRSYSQAQAPIREQTSAEGHAVRLVYMCTAMADVAAKTGDSGLLQACRRLWNNIVTRRMYITGGIGSMAQEESFTLDYDLPNDTAYAETCASIGLIFFAQRMLRIEPHRRYADVMEKALYNTVLGGMAKDGRHFFYVNPLEVWPDACGKNHVYDHVKPVRQGWFGCACCPPNVARLLASLGQYIYTANENAVYVHLYVGGEANLTIQDHKVKLIQQSELPWSGRVRFTVEPETPVQFELMLRMPEWTDKSGVKLTVNGESCTIHTINGYAIIRRKWKSGDIIELDLPMPVMRMKGHPLLRETVGKVAISRGPLVYCLEEADNGKHLHQMYLQSSCELSVAFEPDLLGGVCVIKTEAERLSPRNWEDVLYKEDARNEYEPAAATFIPYFAWANRGEGEMTVWVREHI